MTAQFSTIEGHLTKARTGDVFGHQLQTVLAMAYLFLLPIDSAPGNIAYGLLLAWTCCRMLHTWRSYFWVLRSPAVVVWLTWVAWHATSVLWSSDVHKGLDELGSCRVLLLPFMLWLVLDRLPWLIWALLLGVAVQNMTQFAQILGWMTTRLTDPADRFAGLTHGIKTAAWCCAAMTWNLSAFLRTSGRMRWVSLMLLVAASVGLVASGSRGPWIAAGVALPIMLIVVVIRRPQFRRAAGLVILGALVAGAVAWPLAKSSVMPRIDKALTEFHQALDDHVYWTSVGLRVGFWRWSAGIIKEHPIKGVGAGGFRQAKQQQPDFQRAWESANKSQQDHWLAKNHPHSMTLYVLTSTGLIGGMILLMALVLTLRQTWRDRVDHVFVDGTFFALMSWIIGAQFDTYNITGQLFAMVGLIVAISLPHRAAIRLKIAAKDDPVG